eukprot:CAMPEP_0116893378 /NCGR_PEP_ID=MMETSP0467-20121206/3379_1 /TAXON_ID=283647 /ORGANISM="Mesodinium pulex, Strain SPMC105" /LENGTH=81 /DNA_ID=CAMNT_0004563003 /DNA_START=141 /DNA_END=386 /DNA_ORIENTATION=-
MIEAIAVDIAVAVVDAIVVIVKFNYSVVIGFPAVGAAEFHDVGAEPRVEALGVEVMVALEDDDAFPFVLVVQADHAGVLHA